MISIVVNCHNGEKYLNKCISSILLQKYKKFEVIFYDNCSTDNSKKIIQNFKDQRIKYYFSKKKLSLYKARNEAIKKTSHNLVAFLDVDDWWDKNYLSSKKKFFNDKKIDYFYTNAQIYYEKKNRYVKYNKFTLPNGNIFKYLAKNYFIIISGLIIKKKILKKENYFYEKYNIIGDYDLIMRISKYAIAKSFDETLIFYRVHNSNYSKMNIKTYFYEYKDWYHRQKKINDYHFKINNKFFLTELNKLNIIYQLYKKKNFKLFIKIINFPILTYKLKFLFAFLMPLKVINYFRK